jgi:hypothetical protein
MRDFPSVRATCFAGFARFALGARLAAQRNRGERWANTWTAKSDFMDGGERFREQQ